MESDLNDLITLKQAISDLRLPGHCDHAKSMDGLLLYIRKRAQILGMAADLNECVALGRVALGLHKQGDPDYATCLGDLISDLHSMLRKLDSASDTREAFDHSTSCQDRFSRSETDTDGDAKVIGERVGSGSYYSRIVRVEAKRVRVDE